LVLVFADKNFDGTKHPGIARDTCIYNWKDEIKERLTSDDCTYPTSIVSSHTRAFEDKMVWKMIHSSLELIIPYEQLVLDIKFDYCLLRQLKKQILICGGSEFDLFKMKFKSK